MSIGNIFRRFVVFVLCLMCFSQAMATHIVGGEIYYDYLGNNNYRVTMIIYRDCFNGVPPFDNPASIGVYDQNNNLVRQLAVTVNPDSVLIPPTINNPCFIPPTNICYRKASYTFFVNLPPTSGAYYIVYQRCCRNNSINNILNPDQTGATYIGEIRTSNFFPNSSPRFKALPPPFACLNYPLVFDHSATDLDGDSIRYTLCTPLIGGDTLNPAPAPPTAPPYNNVIYVPPYGINNMLNGTPGIQPLSIDSITGLLTATPNTYGQFVIGVCAKEYRNNVYLGETRRDYQLNVVPCPSLVVAAFLNPITSCGSNTVTFQNGSYGAISYHWDFGVDGATDDTSNAVNPVFTYPDTGTYTVTLLAFSLFNPNCADTITGIVNVRPQMVADFTFTKDSCTNQFQFNDTILSAYTPSSVSYSWNFGDNTSSNIHNPQHTYNSQGNYNVTLIASADGCKDTVVKTVTALPVLSASTHLIKNVSCSGLCDGAGYVQAVNNQGPFTILWTNPPGQTNDSISNLCSGTYNAVITDSAGCTASATLSITEPAPLTLSVATTPDYCGGLCVGTATAQVTGGTAPYSYSWSNGNATSSIQHLCDGNYTVTVTDANGCTLPPVVATVVYIDSIPPLEVIPDSAVIYLGQSVNLQSTVAAGYTYNWQPPTYLSNSAIANPVSTPTQDIQYILTITDQYGCTNSDTSIIHVLIYICDEPEIYIPNAFSPNGDNKNDVVYVYGDQIKELLFRIYDRWGEKVFETTKPGEGWDGTYKGKKVMPGVFVYYVEATCYNDEKFFKKGNITVIH